MSFRPLFWLFIYFIMMFFLILFGLFTHFNGLSLIILLLSIYFILFFKPASGVSSQNNEMEPPLVCLVLLFMMGLDGGSRGYCLLYK